MTVSPFEYVNAIRNKVNADLDTSGYVSFLANRALSRNKVNIHAVNFVNVYRNLSPNMQFTYLMHKVPRNTAFKKWVNPEKHEDIRKIAKVLNLSIKKTIAILPFLNEEQIAILLQEAGKNDNE